MRARGQRPAARARRADGHRAAGAAMPARSGAIAGGRGCGAAPGSAAGGRRPHCGGVRPAPGARRDRGRALPPRDQGTGFLHALAALPPMGVPTAASAQPCRLRGGGAARGSRILSYGVMPWPSLSPPPLPPSLPPPCPGVGGGEGQPSTPGRGFAAAAAQATLFTRRVRDGAWTGGGTRGLP